MKNGGRFIISGLMLSIVSLVLRTVGVSFNAYITGKVGDSGMGLYTLVMSVYTPALTLSTAGVSLASSRLVAEELAKGEKGNAKTALLKTIKYSLCVSLPVMLILMLFSDGISKSWLGDGGASVLLKLLALALPFTAVSTAVSGYFVAVRRVGGSAVIRLSEQFFKIGITVFALGKVIGMGGGAALAAVIACSTLSEIFSFVLLSLLCRLSTRKLDCVGNAENVPKRLLEITLPVSVSSFLRSGLVALEHILIPRGLQKNGMSRVAAMAQYGILGGMAMPIIMFPASFLYSFSGLLIPEFAEEREKKNFTEIRRSALTVIKCVVIFSVGAAGIIFAFSDALGMAIYKNSEAGRYIKILSLLIPVMYLDTAVDSILKGLGEQVYTMKVNILDAFVSVIAVWLLIPRLGLDGYVMIIFISEMINFGFSLFRLVKITDLRVNLPKIAAIPIITVLLSVSSAVYLKKISLSPAVGEVGLLVICISLAVILYALLSVLLGTAFRRANVHIKLRRNGS